MINLFFFQTLLTSQKVLDKGTDYKWYRAWLKDGLLISRGQLFFLNWIGKVINYKKKLFYIVLGPKWRVRRRLLTPAFHFQILDDFVEVFNKQSRILCDVIDKRLESHDVLDVYPLFTNCALDIIMGKQVPTLRAMNEHSFAYILSLRNCHRHNSWSSEDGWLRICQTGAQVINHIIHFLAFVTIIFVLIEWFK